MRPKRNRVIGERDGELKEETFEKEHRKSSNGGLTGLRIKLFLGKKLVNFKMS